MKKSRLKQPAFFVKLFSIRPQAVASIPASVIQAYMETYADSRPLLDGGPRFTLCSGKGLGNSHLHFGGQAVGGLCYIFGELLPADFPGLGNLPLPCEGAQ